MEEAVVRAHWRRRNRDRALPARAIEGDERRCVDSLRREGFAISSVDALFGDRSLFEETAAVVRELMETRSVAGVATAGSKETYLTKLASERFEATHPCVRVALHPAALTVANAYLELRSTLRALEVWHTRPSPGQAVQTQLWHRDADDVMNVKMFVYFTDVTPAAGPLTVAPRTHPLGDRRGAVASDSNGRSTDEQMASVVPESDWRILAGPPGTIVFADTCGYHKQLKPESGERVKLVAQYVSGTPYVPQALAVSGVDPATLTEDQHYAVFSRPRS